MAITEWAAVVTLVVVLGGGLRYVIRAETRSDVDRLDGRINTHEEGCTERQKNIVAEFTHVRGDIARIEARGVSIESKIDRIAERL